MTRIGLTVVAAIFLATGCSSSKSSTTPGATFNVTTSSTSRSSSATAATSTTAPVAALGLGQLKSAALSVTDLPTGWSGQPTTPKTQSLCNQVSVNKAVPPSAMTDVQFVMGTASPFLDEQLISYSDSATANRAFDKFRSNAQACTSFKQNGVTTDIGQLSVPSLGDRSVGYRLMFTQNGSNAVADTQLVQRGPLLIYVAYLDVSADTEQLATFAKLGYDKAIKTLRLA